MGNLGSFVFEDGSLKRILTPEGIVEPQGGVMVYQYFIKDHLGNTKVVCSLIMEKTKRALLIVLSSVFSLYGMAQCWDSESVPVGFSLNETYMIDSLSITESATLMLDHSLALIDSLGADKDSTWFYFIVKLDKRYEHEGEIEVMIEVRQGVEYTIQSFIIPGEGDDFTGAFCYKGYTYFVLTQDVNYPYYKELFTVNKKRAFHTYNNKTRIMDGWVNIQTVYM